MLQHSSPSPAGARRYVPREVVSVVIEFQEDHFRWDGTRRLFFLDEPDTLLGDRIRRTDVQAHRHKSGWSLLLTSELGDDSERGLVDLWSKTPPIEDEPH